MTTVFLVQHSYELDDCDETKTIGVFSSREHAASAIDRLRNQPGFDSRPNDFYVDEYVLDQCEWAEGYVTS